VVKRLFLIPATGLLEDAALAHRRNTSHSHEEEKLSLGRVFGSLGDRMTRI
jgi:hypothetical protein